MRSQGTSITHENPSPSQEMELPFFPCQHQDRGPVWDITLSIYHPKSQPQALEEQHLLQRSKSREKHKCGDSWELKQANVGEFRFGLRRPSATPSQGASGDEKSKAERCGQGQHWVWTICWKTLFTSSSACSEGNSTPSFGSRASKRRNRCGFWMEQQEQPRRCSETQEVLIVHAKSLTSQRALNISYGKILSTGTAITLKIQSGLAYIKMSKRNKGV